ncbi:hypothetical protein ANANG_G00053130 [Anguilla anguilla]|uniref:BTB domain-containing protein n=1 Tax=Anguilla anguilla TaxID=7936 RepID=A0A9D3S4B1_ANGAN|nr:hypothetical protein ANANG_G00053130 [Anguilla anguilla]
MLLSKGHATAILQGCEHFRSDETLCDVTLESGDGSETLPVHRVIMASASGYFKAAFTGEMKGESVVKLQGVSGRGLRTMVDFVYTGGLRLDMDSLRDTLEAARYLQVQPVLQLCNQLLSSELTVDNCVEVGSVAVELQLEEVLGRVQEFVCANFSALVQSGRHLQLSAACLSHALSSDSLRGFTEEDAGLRGDPACAQLLLEASSYQTLPFLQPALQSERTRLRSDSSHLLLLGGVTHRHLAVSRQLCYYDDGAEVWRALRPLGEPRYQHGVAVLGGFLFVVGGQGQYDSKGATATDSAYRYDPRGDRWLQLAPLGEKRTFFHLSVLGGRLYAAGGRNASGELDSVERYDFSRNEWTFVSPMAEPVYGHAGAVHEQLMYISGGITQDTFRKDLWRYDAARDEWRRCADMAAARGLHCMSAAGGAAVRAGRERPVGEGDYADVLSVEAYSPAADQWTAAAPMALGQSDAAWPGSAGSCTWQAGTSGAGAAWWTRCSATTPSATPGTRPSACPSPWVEPASAPCPSPTHSPLQSHAHHYPWTCPLAEGWHGSGGGWRGWLDPGWFGEKLNP